MPEDTVFVLCFDALTLNSVKRYGCDNILQKNSNGMHGNTDISEFDIAQSMILWSSFLEGKNKQEELKKILHCHQIDEDAVLEKISEMERKRGGIKVRLLKTMFSRDNISYMNAVISGMPPSVVNRVEYGIFGGFAGKVLSNFGEYMNYMKRSIWHHKSSKQSTFLKNFAPHRHIDFPSLYSYRAREHMALGPLMAGAINDPDKNLEKFNAMVWKIHKKNRKKLFRAAKRDKYRLILFFTPLADAIGHLNLDDDRVMGEVYRELDDIVEKLRQHARILWILSDHEMEPVMDGFGRPTMFGDHMYTKRGFFSTNQSMEEIKLLRQGIKTHPDIASLDESIKRLGQGSPRITDFHNILSLYGPGRI